jgi:hypothetical protein
MGGGWSIISTEAGTATNSSDLPPFENASLSISRSFDSGPNLTVRRPVQESKEAVRITSTEDGMQIDSSEWHPRNASSSTSRSFDSGPSLTVRRLLQQSKQASEIISIEDGMQIDSNDSQSAKANRPVDRRFESDSNSTVLNPLLATE